MPDVIAIADAVAAELNAGSFSLPFTAKRMLLPDFALTELTDLKVTVVPHGVEMTPFCRQWTQYDYAIDNRCVICRWRIYHDRENKKTNWQQRQYLVSTARRFSEF
jgi:hypothetical protein